MNNEKTLPVSTYLGLALGLLVLLALVFGCAGVKDSVKVTTGPDSWCIKALVVSPAGQVTSTEETHPDVLPACFFTVNECETTRKYADTLWVEEAKETTCYIDGWRMRSYCYPYHLQLKSKGE